MNIYCKLRLVDKYSKKSTGLGATRSQRQRGQALPLGLAFIIVGMLGGLVLFNTGQVAVDKQRLANASDSAAYSGMVWQARALNFQAYSNRAMVANQVSIGQAVTLRSWADYADRTAENAENTLGNIPYIGSFVRVMTRLIQIIATITTSVSEGMITIIDPINKAVGISQTAMFASSFVATPDIVRDVAKASDSRFTADTAYTALGLGNNLTGWKDFTQEYTRDDAQAMTERTKLINDSRDTFSKARNWDFFDKFWVYSTPFTKHKIFREGQTHLAMVERDGKPVWEWMAADTMGFETQIWKGWKGTDRIEASLGWGAAYANSNGDNKIVVNECRSNRWRPDYCRYAYWNDKTLHLAVGSIEKMDSYTGLNEFRSISESIKELQDGEAVLRLKTEVSMDIEKIKSSDQYINNREPFSTPMVSPGQKMSSISVAEVYYRRPDAYKAGMLQRKRLEPANGYNPYWDVRLAPVETTDRLLALGLRGDTGGSVLPGGADAEALASYDPPDSEDDAADEDGTAGTNTNLPLYTGATVATAMGLSSEQATTAYELANSVNANGLSTEFVASAIEGYKPIDKIKGMIETEVGNAIENAALSFAQAAFNGALDAVDPGVRDSIESATTAATEAVALANDLSQKFETMRVKVQEEFQNELVARVGAYEELLAPINEVLPGLKRELADLRKTVERYGENSDGVSNAPGHVRERLSEVREEVGRLSAEARRLRKELENRMTRYLINRIEHYGADLFDAPMPWAQMAEISDYLIDDYMTGGDTNINDLLPWGKDDDV